MVNPFPKIPSVPYAVPLTISSTIPMVEMGNTLVAKKDRKFFRVHKCVNPKCLTNDDEVPKEFRPHKYTNYAPLKKVNMLVNPENMPGKWQLLIFLEQQTILNLQNGEATGCS